MTRYFAIKVNDKFITYNIKYIIMNHSQCKVIKHLIRFSFKEMY